MPHDAANPELASSRRVTAGTPGVAEFCSTPRGQVAQFQTPCSTVPHRPHTHISILDSMPAVHAAQRQLRYCQHFEELNTSTGSPRLPSITQKTDANMSRSCMRLLRRCLPLLACLCHTHTCLKIVRLSKPTFTLLEFSVCTCFCSAPCLSEIVLAPHMRHMHACRSGRRA